MERLVVAAVLVVLAVTVAYVLERRRRPDAPVQDRWPVPTQLDRADFDRPDAPWLVAVFTSATCDSCARALAAVAALESGEVAVQEVEAAAHADLHTRYGVEAVPTLVVADAEGAVRSSFVGPPRATELWAAVARVRELADEEPGGLADEEPGGLADEEPGGLADEEPGGLADEEPGGSAGQ